MQVTPPVTDGRLDLVCRELNFAHSLVADGHEVRALAVRALERSAQALDDLAAGRERRAGCRGVGAEHDRLHEQASRARLHAARAREMRATLEALPLDAPRPSH